MKRTFIILFSLVLILFVGCGRVTTEPIDNKDNKEQKDDPQGDDDPQDDPQDDPDDDPNDNPQDDPDYSTLKLMSFNALSTESTEDDKWSVRKSAVIEMFKEVLPDIVGLQECQKQSADICELLPQYQMYKMPYDDANPSATQGPIILYNTNRVTLIDCGFFWLGETPDSPCKPFGASDTHYRICTWIKCQAKGYANPIFFFNTHLPYKSEDHAQRLKCADLIISRMKKECGTESMCFLVGDMNQAHYSSAAKVEHTNFYCLAPFYKWMKEGRETAPQSDSYGSHSASIDNAPSSNPVYDIDHIFYRNCEAVKFSTVIKKYGVKYLSDHYPITLTVKCNYVYTGNPEDDKEPEDNPGEDEEQKPLEGKGIASAEDLVAFAAAVNSGASLEQWQNDEGAVALLRDIDMSSVTDWTPIGYATVTFSKGVNVSAGNVFNGTFDGNGFKIKKFDVKATLSTANRPYGFFGTVGEGSCVKNLKFDSSCSFDLTTTAVNNVGVLAGAVAGADIRDVTSEAKLLVTGKSGGRTYAGGLVGYSYAFNGHAFCYDSCISVGDITFANGDSNTLTDYKGYTIGGLLGFTDSYGGTTGVVSECINKSKIISYAHRSGGIAGTVSKNAILNNCENSGEITNSYSTKWYGRSGGICAVAGASVQFTGCRNYGDCIMTNYGYVGAILCLIGGDGIALNRCENYGTVLSGSSSRGLMFGYAQKYSSTISNCIVDGKLGSLAAPNNINNPGWDQYGDAEKEKYLGYTDSKSTVPTISGITYALQTSGKPAVDYTNAKLKILFIGNSFTLDAVNRLPGFITAAGLDGIQLTHMYYGGRTIPEYLDGWSTSTDYSCYQLGPGRETWATEKGHSLEEIVGITNWDIITIQEHTGTASAWDWEKTSSRVPSLTEKDAVAGLVSKIKAACPNKNVKLYYLLSQAYGQGHSILTKNPSYFTGQDGMFKCICDMARKVMATGYFEGIISTAAMLQNLRKTSLNTPMDLTRDGYHMDYGVARYGAAALVFETLITPSSYADGKTLDGTTYRVTESNTTSGTYCTPVDDAAAAKCISAARAAKLNPYEVK